MFKVKKTSTEELLKWILACQMNDPNEDGIISDKGLRVDPVPEVEDDELDWEPSGLYDANKWRKK